MRQVHATWEVPLDVNWPYATISHTSLSETVVGNSFQKVMQSHRSLFWLAYDFEAAITCTWSVKERLCVGKHRLQRQKGKWKINPRTNFRAEQAATWAFMSVVVRFLITSLVLIGALNSVVLHCCFTVDCSKDII